MLLETASAQYGPALGWLEGDSGLGAALRTRGAGFRTHFLASTNPLCLALLATLGIVLELLVVEEDLLARSKDEFRAAVNTGEYAISEFHGRLP